MVHNILSLISNSVMKYPTVPDGEFFISLGNGSSANSRFPHLAITKDKWQWMGAHHVDT
jgi:hypothetical protein